MRQLNFSSGTCYLYPTGAGSIPAAKCKTTKKLVSLVAKPAHAGTVGQVSIIIICSTGLWKESEEGHYVNSLYVVLHTAI